MPQTGYAPVNGMEMYWEGRGAGGVPLIVTHGGFGTTAMFGGLLDELAASRRVIAVELQGHGHTADIERPFSYEAFGEDIAALASHLGLGEVDLLGYSLGGGVSLRCAIGHPGLVRRLVVACAPCRREGWFPEVLAAMAQVGGGLLEQMRRSPLFEAWASVAPDVDAIPTVMDKTGALLRNPYDWSDEVAQLAIPVQLVFADADSIPPAHAAEFFALLGGGLRDGGWDGSMAGPSRLAILPGRTHYDAISAPGLAAIAARFLDDQPGSQPSR
jgi:pimeloyl-ACP methyl ester carboxylesterase